MTPPAAQPPRSDETFALALVTRVVTDMREQAHDESARLSQALLGEVAAVLDLAGNGGWARVRLERDGTSGWMHARALRRCSRSEAEAYGQACDALVSTELLPAFGRLAPLGSGGGQVGADEVGKLPFGLAVPAAERKGLWAAVHLPDGARWWVSNILLPIANRPAPDAPGMAFVLGLLRRFVGIPYLPGGRTPYGFDDAGLAQALWGFVGVNLPREASRQFEVGQPVEAEPQPGDLVFFGEMEGSRRSISHVAISLGGDDLIHANRYTWSVAIHSLNAESSLYHAWLCDHLAGVRRYRS